MTSRDSFFRQVIAVTSGSVIGQMVLLAVTPLLTRLYGPNEFGVFGLFTVFVNSASVALALRFDMAIPAARSALLAERLLALNFAVLIPTSFVGKRSSSSFCSIRAGSASARCRPGPRRWCFWR